MSSSFPGFKLKERPTPSTVPQAPSNILDTLKKHGILKQPERAGWTDYTGTFWSSKYNRALSRGNVYVQLPDVPSPEPIQVEAQIQYKGIYRLNSSEKFVLTMTDKDDAKVSEFETKPTKVQGHDAPHGKGELTFKVEKREGDKISGTYVLSHPKDRGQFEIRKGMTHGEQCVIM